MDVFHFNYSMTVQLRYDGNVDEILNVADYSTFGILTLIVKFDSFAFIKLGCI